MDKLKTVEIALNKINKDEDVVKTAIQNLELWLNNQQLAEYRPYINHLIRIENWALLLDCFWRMMPFGTGGRRGPIGAGPNRINPYTISLSVQGHCEYLKNVVGVKGEPCVVVAHDVRQFLDMRGLYKGVNGILNELTSLDMAKASAMTYAANGITAYVVGALEDDEDVKKCTDRYLSTPELSFLIRELGAAGGLNISASHNHPDDNGGKFYNSFGGQEIPPDDEALLNVVDQVSDVKTIAYRDAKKQGLIKIVSSKMHKKYIDLNKALSPTASRSAKIAFTPLCGTGLTTVDETLKALDYNVIQVPEQSIYDGSFLSVKYRIANPEVPDSMDKLGEVAAKNSCDIGFSTDPDADRLGMIVASNGGFDFVNGNEIGVILIQSIISSKIENGSFKKGQIFINTLVTSSLQREIAIRNGCQVVGDLMVGFKYMGDVLGHLEKSGKFPPENSPSDSLSGKDSIEGSIDDFIFTCEESHGYLLSQDIRDKDACGAAVHLAGLASILKDKGISFKQYIRNIYRVYGYHRNVLRSLVMEGITGLKRIEKIQDILRSNPPEQIAGYEVLRFTDNHVVGGILKSSTDKASRNVLLFELDGGGGRIIRLVVRPSGTEPKTKLYVEVPSKVQIGGTIDETTPEQLAEITDEQLNGIIKKTDEEADLIANVFMKFCLGKEILGDIYPIIPEQSLLVSDLVPIDYKIQLCTEILPQFIQMINNSEDTEEWLDKQLKPFGEDARSLVHHAALDWIEWAVKKGDLSENKKNTAILIFKK